MTSGFVEINCDYSTEYWNYTNQNFNLYTCITKSASIIAPDTTITIKGNHGENKTNEDVVALAIVSGKWNFFPSGFETFFKNIKAISMENVSLTSITAVNLEPFSKLELLQVSGNNLQSFNAEMIEFISNLSDFVIENNKMTESDQKILIVLKSVNDLKNRIADINFKIEPLLNLDKKVIDLEVKYESVVSNQESKINADFAEENIRLNEEQKLQNVSDELNKKLFDLQQDFLSQLEQHQGGNISLSKQIQKLESALEGALAANQKLDDRQVLFEFITIFIFCITVIFVLLTTFVSCGTVYEEMKRMFRSRQNILLSNDVLNDDFLMENFNQNDSEID